MKLPKQGDIVTIEHYGTGKVVWLEGRSFKVKLPKPITRNFKSGKATVNNISCYLSDLISITPRIKDDLDFEEPQIKPGSIVKHRNFGLGEVKKIYPANNLVADGNNAVVYFDATRSEKTLFLPYAQLEVIRF